MWWTVILWTVVTILACVAAGISLGWLTIRILDRRERKASNVDAVIASASGGEVWEQDEIRTATRYSTERDKWNEHTWSWKLNALSEQVRKLSERVREFEVVAVSETYDDRLAALANDVMNMRGMIANAAGKAREALTVARGDSVTTDAQWSDLPELVERERERALIDSSVNRWEGSVYAQGLTEQEREHVHTRLAPEHAGGLGPVDDRGYPPIDERGYCCNACRAHKGADVNGTPICENRIAFHQEGGCDV